MATNPTVTTTIQDTATAIAAGVDTIAVIAPVATSADTTPRLFGSAAAVYAQHGYSEGVEYVARHCAETRKSVLFVGIPIATDGAVGRQDTSGNTGTCTTTLAAGSDGVLAEHDGVLTVVTGGTVGTHQIVLDLSLDGGRTTRRVRLGTGTSYAIPYSGVTVSFATGETLVAGDVIHTWHGSGPRGDAAGWAAARAALAASSYQFRSVLLVGDMQDGTEGAAFAAQMLAFENSHQRFVHGRASIIDRSPLATLSSTTHRMNGSPTVTFAEVGATADTITRSAGSWISDGFVVGDMITVTGSASNNITGTAMVTAVSALVLTLDTDDLAAEGPKAGVTVIGTPSLTWAAAGETCVRSEGSWLADGFRVGDAVVVTGTASNNGTHVITALTASTLTAAASTYTNEVVRTTSVTAATGQTKAAWMAAKTAAFETVTSNHRVSLGAGRARWYSPLTQWYQRISPAWRASVRSYQHDLHIPTWAKALGPTGDSLLDEDGNLEEWDDLVDGGAGSAARFTTYRSWANGPRGAFIAQDLTRAEDASLLSRAHNTAVAQLAQSVCQAATEQLVGRVLLLNADGTATRDSLATLSSEVNSALELALLQDRGEGQRTSFAVWTPADDDILNVAEPVLTGTLALQLLGTIHSVNTTVRVLSGGQ